MPQHVRLEGDLPRRPSRDTRAQLTKTSVSLHWLAAISMIAMLVFGLYLDTLERGDAKSAMVQLHKSFGTLFLILVAARVLWRMHQGPLEPLGDHARWQEIAAKVSHHLLLFGTIAMPLTGLVRTIGRARGVDIFGFPFIPQLLAEKNETLSLIGSVSHKFIGYGMLAVIAVHAVAALKHHLLDRDGTLQRMLGSRVG